MFYDMGATHTTATIVCKCFTILLSAVPKSVHMPMHVFYLGLRYFLQM